MTNQQLSDNLKLHTKVLSVTFVGALWLTGFLMFVLMGLGIWKIVLGIYLEIRPAKEDINDVEGFIDILKGLEFIFISPLFYLLVLSLTKYITSAKAEIEATEPSLEKAEKKKKLMVNATIELMNVKILSIGLFISVLILHSLTFILKDTSQNPPVVFIIGLFVVLIGYYFVLDILIERLRKSE